MVHGWRFRRGHDIMEALTKSLGMEGMIEVDDTRWLLFGMV